MKFRHVNRNIPPRGVGSRAFFLCQTSRGSFTEISRNVPFNQRYEIIVAIVSRRKHVSMIAELEEKLSRAKLDLEEAVKKKTVAKEKHKM